MNQRAWAKRVFICLFCLGVVLSFSRTTVLPQPLQSCDIDGDNDVDRNDIETIVAARNTPAGIADPRDIDGDGTITVNDARLCTLRCTKARCSDGGTEVTQIFSDLQPTQPSEEEIAAPPLDQESRFPPEGPPVEPGPPVAIDGNFWEMGTIEEFEKHFEGLIEQPAQFNEPLQQFPQVPSPSVLCALQPLGEWRPLRETTGAPGSGDVAIHAALLRSTAAPPDAEILYFAGDAYDWKASHDRIINQGQSVNHTHVFKVLDPARNMFQISRVDTPAADGLFVDLFSSGHALLEDGRLLVVGGTDKFPQDATGTIHAHLHATANRESFIFDPKTTMNSWSGSFPLNFEPRDNLVPIQNQGGGRWYPTLVTLNSNNVLAFWGHPAGTDSRHTNDTPEVFRLQRERGTWTFLGRETDLEDLRDNALSYPRVYLLPNGRVFRATPMTDLEDSSITMNVEINPIPESLVNPSEISVRVSKGPPTGYSIAEGYYYSSVLLPLRPLEKYKARILLVGGFVIQPHQPHLIALGTDTGVRWPPLSPEEQRRLLKGWTPTGPRRLQRTRDEEKKRYHANATILPTGEIFVSGGRFGHPPPLDRTLDRTAVLEGEIYNPISDNWCTVARAHVPREYHSVALLMPDGRVWHAGTSNTDKEPPPGQPEPPKLKGSGWAAQEHRIELYEPWYYSRTRPIISLMRGVPDRIYRGAILMHPHDSSVQVQTTHFRPIQRFALVRAGSVTHAFNSDQRYIELERPELLRSESFQLDGVTFSRSTFRLTSPPSTSIAPPGNYLLFAIDDRNVPSIGRFIRIDRQFVGELKQEAENFTSRTQERVSMVGDPNDPRALALTAQLGPFESCLCPLLEYGGIDFGPDSGVVKQFSALVSSLRSTPGRPTEPPGGGGIFRVRLDRPDGPPIATLQISPTDAQFAEQTTSLGTVSGVHNVFISFEPRQFPGLEPRPSPSPAAVTVDWFKFK